MDVIFLLTIYQIKGNLRYTTILATFTDRYLFYFRLPGTTFVKGQHTWLMGANEVDSRVFSRAILAKVISQLLTNVPSSK